MTLRRFNGIKDGDGGEMGLFDYGWKIGISFKTDVSTLAGGVEQRVSRYETPIRKYTVPFGDKQMADLNKIYKFFYDHRGKALAFLFLDTNSDMLWEVKSEDIDSSVGFINKIFLPFENVYPLDLAEGSFTFTTEDVRVVVDSVDRTTDMTFDRVANTITFTADKPADTSIIEVQYLYYSKVRFDTDDLQLEERINRYGNTTIPLIEVK